MRACEYCGGEVSDTARKCKHCGEWLKKDIDQPQTVQKETKTCKYCGGEVSNTAKKCKHCGEWITEQETQLSPNKSTQIKFNINTSNDIGDIIETYIKNNIPDSKVLISFPSEDVIENMQIDFDKREKPLLLLDNTFYFFKWKTNNKNATGILITNEKIYFRLHKDSFYSSYTGIEGLMHGYCELNRLNNIEIGEETTGYKDVYQGHKFIINTEIIGKFRIGNSSLLSSFDEKAFEYLNSLFTEINNNSKNYIEDISPIVVTKAFKELGKFKKAFWWVMEILGKIVSILK